MAGCTNIDRKTFILSVAGFVCMLLLQIGTVIWWASNLSAEVKGIKDDIANVRTLGANVARLEQRMNTVEGWIQEFRPLQMEFVRSVERLNNLANNLRGMEEKLNKTNN